MKMSQPHLILVGFILIFAFSGWATTSSWKSAMSPLKEEARATAEKNMKAAGDQLAKAKSALMGAAPTQFEGYTAAILEDARSKELFHKASREAECPCGFIFVAFFGTIALLCLYQILKSILGGMPQKKPLAWESSQ